MIATDSASAAAALALPCRCDRCVFAHATNVQEPALCSSQRDSPAQSAPQAPRPTVGRAIWLLLALPYLGLCFPWIYARATPALLGFPFFYWYQFAWVILTACLLGIVYRKLRRP